MYSKKTERVIDLCAAPGSWSQVLSKEMGKYFDIQKETRIVSVDLFHISPIPGVTTV